MTPPWCLGNHFNFGGLVCRNVFIGICDGLLTNKTEALELDLAEDFTDMTYTRYIPSPPLNAYINDVYYLDGPAPYPRQKVIPNPALHLMVNFGHPFQVFDSDQTQPVSAQAHSSLSSHKTLAFTAYTPVICR